MLQSYEGYAEGGKVFFVDPPTIPDGARLIITVLEESASRAAHVESKLRAFQKFREGLKCCEPLPPEFDEILSQRVTIARKLNL